MQTVFSAKILKLFDLTSKSKKQCNIYRYPSDQDMDNEDLLRCYALWHTNLLESIKYQTVCKERAVTIVALARGLADSLGAIDWCFRIALQRRLPFFVYSPVDWSTAIEWPFDMNWKKHEHLFHCSDNNSFVDLTTIQTDRVKCLCPSVSKECNELGIEEPKINKSVMMQFVYHPVPKIVYELRRLQKLLHKFTLVAIHIRTYYYTNDDIRNHFLCFQKYKSINKNALGVLLTDSMPLINFVEKKRREGLLEIFAPDGNDTILAHAMDTSATNPGIYKAFKDFFTLGIVDTAILTKRSTFSLRASIYFHLKKSKTLGPGKAMFIPGNRMRNKASKLPSYCKNAELGFEWPTEGLGGWLEP